MDEIKNKKIMYSIIGIAVLLISVVGVTYSFFNYTRTGALNNLGTGRIYFNSTQNGTLNITNVFPLTSTEASNANLDTVTVGIVGDTTYADGEEFEISLVNVTNTINGKSISINYIATYAPNTGKVIGTPSNDYWNAREDKDANIYLLNATGEVTEGKQVLVGYVDNGANGINGTLTIKAYIDSDRIAISDTYPQPESSYQLNNNMTQEELTKCVNYFNNQENIEFFCKAPPCLDMINSFCRGNGTNNYPGGETFQEMIDNGELTATQINYFVQNNIIIYNGNGTTNEWVNERTVYTTEEWNSFATTPISFKIRAESNEGIWVEEPAQGTIESCPGCKYIYRVVNPEDDSTRNWTTWNMGRWDDINSVAIPGTPSVLTSGLYDSYEELIATIGKNYFLGVKLNNNNEVTNAYACGVKDNVPFCIEGKLDSEFGGTEAETTYAINQSLLQGTNLYNNTCTVDVESSYTQCGPWDNSGSLSADAGSSGNVFAGVGDDDFCAVEGNGHFGCYESDSGGE